MAQDRRVGTPGRNLREYLRKGSQVYVEGRLQTRFMEDKEGNKRYITEVVAQNMQMLGSAAGREAWRNHRRTFPYGRACLDPG